MVGVDISRDQLRVAQARTRTLVLASARAVRFPDASFPTVVCTYLHTDTDDISPVFAEAHRVLQPWGTCTSAFISASGGHFVETHIHRFESFTLVI